MIDLSKWNNMLEDLKKESRGQAILNRMTDTLNKMKGELKQCGKF